MFKGSTEELDRIVRLYVYGQFLEYERPPKLDRIVEALHSTNADIRESYQRLARDHSLVLSRDGNDVRMAMPFSAKPTPFEVSGVGRRWYANCAWDALGVPAMLNCDARILSTCGDCGEEISIDVMGGAVFGGGELIHFAVPAARWWDDIFFT
jgi:hypothetical protein